MSYTSFKRKRDCDTLINKLCEEEKITPKQKRLLQTEMKRSEYIRTINKRGTKKDTALVKQATKEVIEKKSQDNSDDYNTKVINHISNVNNIKKPLLDQPNSIKRCVNEYFNLCKKDNVRPTISGLSMAIGVNRLTLLDWANGSKKIQNQEVIQHALSMIEMFVESSMITGKMNPIPAVFLMKNNHGYKDEQNIKVENNGDNVSNDDLKKKYLEEDKIINAEFEEK